MEEKRLNKRQLQAEQTKISIFHAALELLERTDFESITVRDIVRKAGVSVGSFYNAYSSKLEVFYQTYEIADGYFEREVGPMLAQKDPIGGILLFFEEYARYNSVRTPIALTRVLYNPDNPYFHRAGSRGMVPILTEQIRRAMDCGALTAARKPDAVAEYLMICARGIVYDWCLAKGRYDLTERIREYIPYLLRAFEPS